MAGLYIHIPFCESRCIYCGFYSTTALHLREEYVEALCREMELRKARPALSCHGAIETVYIGGGTPSLLNTRQVGRLLDCAQDTFRFHPKEITMECNPDDVTEDFANAIGLLPINRISMGAQTFDDDRLRFLRRRHSAKDVPAAMERLRRHGISNVSIDLMFGFPGESIEAWAADIQQALDLKPEHISAYSLMIEEGTPLHRLLKKGEISEPDEEQSLEMYNLLCDKLMEAGYEHYEISNFSRPGYLSRHNSSYWQDVPYIGIGAAAHSYTKTRGEDGKTTYTRSWNIDNIRQYIRSINEGILPSEHETLNKETRYNDLITTALRTREGIDLNRLKEEFGQPVYQSTMREAESKLKGGLMKISHRHLSLTRKGLYISDDIMSDFMMV